MIKIKEKKRRKLTPFGLQIKKFAAESGLRLIDIENMLGMPRYYLSQIIHGNRTGRVYLKELDALLAEWQKKKAKKLRKELEKIESGD